MNFQRLLIVFWGRNGFFNDGDVARCAGTSFADRSGSWEDFPAPSLGNVVEELKSQTNRKLSPLDSKIREV